MMEKGTIPVAYKGKSLSDINIDVSQEYVEEHEIEGNVRKLNSKFCTKKSVYYRFGCYYFKRFCS